jgi:hypothetical protein
MIPKKESDLRYYILPLDRGVPHRRQLKAQAVERAFRQLPDEAVVSKAKDRADSARCRALGREEAQALT